MIALLHLLHEIYRLLSEVHRLLLLVHIGFGLLCCFGGLYLCRY
jgi:hypothetical protein